nr:DNA-directed RNA polymerase subunit beta [Peribacillus kribbensis]
MSMSREKYQKEKRESVKGNTKKKVRVRLIPIWLRIIIVAALILISVSAGAIVGYSILGNGKPFDVFKSSTWTHISDLVNQGVK